MKKIFLVVLSFFSLLFLLFLPVVAQSHLPADVNHDGQIDKDDIFSLLLHWLQTGPFANLWPDVNQDGVINSLDHAQVIKDYGTISKKTPSVLIDGPWTQLPSGAGTGMGYDSEIGALTLATKMTDQVFLLKPDTSKPVFANTVWDLKPFDDRLYIGYGDLGRNKGPIDIISYDPTTGILQREYDNAPDEQLDGLHLGDSERFYVCGADSQESWTFGSFYVNDGVDWEKRRTIYKGLHVNSLVEFKNRLYASYGTDRAKPVSYPFVLSSDNWGASWNYEKVYEGSYARPSSLGTLKQANGEFLYATICYNGCRLFRTDGQKWAEVPISKEIFPYGPHYGFSIAGNLLFLQGMYFDVSGSILLKFASYDGFNLKEIDFLKGRPSSELYTLRVYGLVFNKSWFYALLSEADDQSIIHQNLYRTQDLETWEKAGEIKNLPSDGYITVMEFFHERLYVGVSSKTSGSGLYTAANLLNTAEYTSSILNIAGGLNDPSLFFDANTPPDTSVKFQVRSGMSEAEVNRAAFTGPDGTINTYYETSGQSLWPGHDGDTFIQYKAILSSQDQTVAPFLNKTVIVTNPNRFDSLAIEPAATTWVAGEGKTITVTAPTPVSGEVDLQARDSASGEELSIKPATMTLADGQGVQEVMLTKATATKICVSLAGVTDCSAEIEVKPGPAESVDIQTALPEPNLHWSPFGTANIPFDVSFTIWDRYRNTVTGYTGTIECRQWRDKPSAPALLTYAFQWQDQGYHEFSKGMTISQRGEWNIVCQDADNPRLAGSLTVNIR